MLVASAHCHNTGLMESLTAGVCKPQVRDHCHYDLFPLNVMVTTKHFLFQVLKFATPHKWLFSGPLPHDSMLYYTPLMLMLATGDGELKVVWLFKPNTQSPLQIVIVSFVPPVWSTLVSAESCIQRRVLFMHYPLGLNVLVLLASASYCFAAELFVDISTSQ